jgi:hypothetical protein
MLTRRTLLKSILAAPLTPLVPSEADWAMVWPEKAVPLTVCNKQRAPGWFQIRVRKETHQAQFYELGDGRLQALVRLEDCHLLILWCRGPGEMELICNAKPGVRNVTLPVEWYRAKCGLKPGELLGPWVDEPSDWCQGGAITLFEDFQ